MGTQARVAAIAGFAAALFAAGPAQAAFIAGWDFTQYSGAASLNIDSDQGQTVDTLKSNYSDFDPTAGAGGLSQPYGTMWMNGTNGSTNVDETAALPIFRSTSGSLTPNVGTPGANEVPIGDVGFNTSSANLNCCVSGNYLAGIGQDFNSNLSMIAAANVSIVFEANVSSLNSVSEDWELIFAGVTNNGSSDVSVEFSTDGINWTALAAATLTTTQTAFTRTVAGMSDDSGFFRLGFVSTGTATATPRIDNVTISGDVSIIPEPGTAALLGLGLAGLGVVGRRRD